MNLKCLFGHKYNVIKSWHYYDTSYGDRIPSSHATYKCSRCGKIHTALYYAAGFLTAEQMELK